MANTETLLMYSLDKRTPEEVRAITSKGGKASAEAKKKKKAMRETCEIVLSMPLKSIADAEAVELADIQSLAETKGCNLTVQDAIIIKQVQLALMGSIRAVEFLRDTVGEKPKVEAEIDFATLDKLDSVLDQIGGVI